MERAFVDKVPPSLTNVRELAPPESGIPTIVLIQSIAVKYAEKYIIVDPRGRRTYGGTRGMPGTCGMPGTRGMCGIVSLIGC